MSSGERVKLSSQAFVRRVRELAPAGSLTIAFDTNTIGGLWGGDLRNFKAFFDLCSKINQLNDLLRPHAPQARRAVRTCVSALVHAEVLHDLRQHYGPKYDPLRISKALANEGLSVDPLTREQAETLAQRLGARFPRASDWRQHKLDLAARCLGINGRLGELKVIPPTSRCGATTDWLIGSHAHQSGAILVTNDEGPEFEDVVSMRREELVAAIDELAAR